MQNRKFFATLTAAIALTAGLASCSNNDDELNPKNEGRIPITLTSNVGSRATDQSLQETQIANGVLVGGYINQGDSKLADLQLTSNGSGEFTGQNLTTDNSEATLDIYAYAPYKGEGVTSSNTFTIEQDQSGNDVTGGYILSDLMIAKSEGVAPTSSPINLTFEHKMAKLNLYFDLTGATGVTLDNATVSVLQVVPSVTVDLANATVTTGTGSQVDIIAAKEVSISSDTKASVVFPSQTINSGTDFVQIVADDKTYTAKLPSNVEFKSGMKYAYTVKFTTSGDEGGSGTPGGTTIQLVPGNATVNPWGDGTMDQYKVGDYVTSDGTIIPQAEAATHAKQSDIVAVIFSKEVSETDKKDGYNAYAMELEAKTAQFDKPELEGVDGIVTGYNVPKYTDALGDFEGLTKTKAALQWYKDNSQTIPSNSIFSYCAETSAISSLTSSQWFVPSFGQMVQFLNNIGGAGITKELPGEGEYDFQYSTVNPIYTSDDTNTTSVFTQLAQCATDAGKESLNFISTSDNVYVTVTESLVSNNLTFWCFQVKSGSWCYGHNPGKNNYSSRKLLRCVAIQLPTASTPISATEATE